MAYGAQRIYICLYVYRHVTDTTDTTDISVNASITYNYAQLYIVSARRVRFTHTYIFLSVSAGVGSRPRCGDWPGPSRADSIRTVDITHVRQEGNALKAALVAAPVGRN